MSLTRRTVLGAGIIASSGAPLVPGSARAEFTPRLRAVAFDALAVFDTSAVAARAESLFPGKGAALMNLWRTRQFEYAWLRTISHRYRGFMGVTEDALVFAAAASNLMLSSEQRDELLGLYLALPAWPEANAALLRLKAAGARLALLSNFSQAMLENAIMTSSLNGVFEHALSTDAVRVYKPDPRAYHLGTEALGLAREQILFVASAGWDADGAKAYGYPTFWVNRPNLPREQLGAPPDGAGQSLADVMALASSSER